MFEYEDVRKAKESNKKRDSVKVCVCVLLLNGTGISKKQETRADVESGAHSLLLLYTGCGGNFSLSFLILSHLEGGRVVMKKYRMNDGRQ